MVHFFDHSCIFTLQYVKYTIYCDNHDIHLLCWFANQQLRLFKLALQQDHKLKQDRKRKETQRFENDAVLEDVNHVFCEEILSELPL